MITIVCSYCGEHKPTHVMDLTYSFVRFDKKCIDYDAKCLKCWKKEEDERRQLVQRRK